MDIPAAFDAAVPLVFLSSAKLCGVDPVVIPAKAGIHSDRHPGESRDPLAVALDLRRYAKTDSRPCVSTRILRAGHFLLLAQEKVTKEKGSPGRTPAAPVRYGRPGFR